MNVNFEVTKDSSVQKIVKIMLAEKCITIAELARRMNEVSDYNYTRFNLAQKLSRNSLKFAEMALICEILDYKIDISLMK